MTMKKLITAFGRILASHNLLVLGILLGGSPMAAWGITLSVSGGTTVGQSPLYTISGAPTTCGNSTIYWYTWFSPATGGPMQTPSVDVPNGSVNSSGNASISGNAWTTSTVGVWSVQVNVCGQGSNIPGITVTSPGSISINSFSVTSDKTVAQSGSTYNIAVGPTYFNVQANYTNTTGSSAQCYVNGGSMGSNINYFTNSSPATGTTYTYSIYCSAGGQTSTTQTISVVIAPDPVCGTCQKLSNHTCVSTEGANCCLSNNDCSTSQDCPYSGAACATPGCGTCQIVSNHACTSDSGQSCCLSNANCSAGTYCPVSGEACQLNLAAPTLSAVTLNPANSSANPLPAGTAAVQVSFTTNLNASCSIGGGTTGQPMTAFGAGAGGDGTTSHAVNLTTFNGEAWTYDVTCTNSSPGGATSPATTVSIYQAQNLAAPTLGAITLNPANSSANPLPAGTAAVQVSFTTNLNASCSIGGGTSGQPMTPFGSGAGGDGTTSHAVNLTTFNGEDWTYNVTCTNSNPGGATSPATTVSIYGTSGNSGVPRR